MEGNLLLIKANNFYRILLFDSHSLHPHTHPYHHQVPPKNVLEAKGLKRKLDKLSKWESQSPADRSLSDHAQGLESRAGT
jgi:hypothetical protein